MSENIPSRADLPCIWRDGCTHSRACQAAGCCQGLARNREQPLSKSLVDEMKQVTDKAVSKVHEIFEEKPSSNPVAIGCRGAYQLTKQEGWREAADEIERLNTLNLELGHANAEECSRLQQRVAELEQDIDKCVANHAADLTAQPPATPHLREPPHCSTCACGMPSEPPAASQYVVPHVVMDTIYETLKFYANLCSYEGERTGGVLAGCPRGPAPTPQQLIPWAQRAMAMIDSIVLGREALTKPATPDLLDIPDFLRNQENLRAERAEDEKPRALPMRTAEGWQCSLPALPSR